MPWRHGCPACSRIGPCGPWWSGMPVVLMGVLIRTNGSRSAPRRAGLARRRPRRSLSVPTARCAASAWSSRCGTGISASTVSGAAWSPPTAHDCAAGCPPGAWMTGLPVLQHQAGPAAQLRGRAGADDHAIPLPAGKPLEPDRRGELLLPLRPGWAHAPAGSSTEAGSQEAETRMASSGAAASTWAPLRIGLFRSLWIAALISSVGTWMQTVGAQWLLVHSPHAAVLVPLVQTADTLPAVLFALAGGVLADIFDRARLLVAVLAGMTAAGGALTVLTAAHRMPPALLLMFTFILGTGAILVTPAYQSLVPDMVPRPLLPSASALSSININLARAIGPAIAGLLVAQIGVAAVFALNTATFLFYAVVVAFHPRLGGTPQSSERFLPGLRAGGRYVRNAPVVRRILLRAALFLIPGSCLWALLPLVATTRLGLGAGGYGVLLAALGVGAIGGAFVLPQVRARLSANAMVAAASLIYAAALAVTVLSRNLVFTLVVLLVAGVAWIA